MTGTVMIYRNKKCESRGRLPLDKGLKDATADYCKRRWSTNTAKQAARAFDLSVSQGRNLAAGDPSLTTIERIFKTGGWRVSLVILADVLGQSVWNYIIELRRSHEQQGETLRALGHDLRLVVSDRDSFPPDVDSSRPDRRRPVDRRVG